MENANKVQHWNNSLASPMDNIRPTLVVGIVLTVMIVYGLVLILPLTDGLARGAVVPVLRLGQALLVLGFMLFLLARPGPLGKNRLTAIDLAFGLFFLSEAVFPLLALYYRGEHLDLNSRGPFGTGTPLQTLLGPLQYYLVYRIVVATITSERQIAIALKLSFVASIAVSIIGIAEKFVTPVHTFIQTYYPPIAWKNRGPGLQHRPEKTENFSAAPGNYTAFRQHGLAPNRYFRWLCWVGCRCGCRPYIVPALA